MDYNPSAPATPPSPPAKKGLPVLAWIAIGCIGLIVLGGIAFTAVTYMGARWVKNRVEEAAEKPVETAAKMIALSNPDIQFVSADEQAKSATFRDKKTGKELTFSLDDIENGKISFKTDEGTVSIGGQGNGNEGSVTMTDSQGKTVFQAGSGSTANSPSWVPLYPGAQMEGSATANGADGSGGALTLKTSDSPEAVRDYYRDQLNQAGMKVNEMNNALAGTQLLIVTGEGSGHHIAVQIASYEGKTQISLQYSDR